MADRPMGFGPHDRDDDEPGRGEGGDDGPVDPFAAFGQLFGPGGTPDPAALAKALEAAGAGQIDPAQLQQVLGQVQRMMATPGDGGPVNWRLAHDLARQALAQAGDPSVGGSQRRAVEDAVRLADTWLDDATDLPAAGARALAWSRSEWVEGSWPVWQRLVEPVADSVATAMSSALAQQVPPELAAGIPGAGDPAALLRQVGGSVFGLQLGQAVAALAGEVVSGTEIGLPLVEGAVVLLPANADAFGEGLDVPADEVRLYLALREAARSRLFAHVPWIGPLLLGAVGDYARGITIDTSRIEEAVRDADLSDPESIQRTLAGGMFEPETTPAQQAALDRLETALALVEGWVEVVTTAAAGQLPHAVQLRESVRRRRATGGPAEQTFATLVGLELRPRRLRDAAALWEAIAEARGVAGRDAVWAHPDLLPTAADLDDPAGYARRSADADAESAEVDAALEALLSQGEAESPDGDDPAPPRA
ncbi:zinc-dependent metalloprotease [Angustibacter aerolatus]